MIFDDKYTSTSLFLKLHNGTVPLMLEAPPIRPAFMRAFWLITVSILVQQVYAFALAISHGAMTGEPSDEYSLISAVSSVIWQIATFILVLVDIRLQKVPAAELFRFDFTRLEEHLPTVFKYFAGCAAFVILLSLLNPTPELIYKGQPPLERILLLLSAVILAPIIEEMMFRGYLYTAMLSVFKREKERLVVNAMLFATVHVFFVDFLLGGSVPFYIFIIGFLLAKLYEKSRSILPCIVLHFLNNGLVFAIELIQMSRQ